jgi:acetate kinase
VGEAILALNAGSSSLKFALFAPGAGGLTPLCRGEIETLGDGASRFHACDAAGGLLVDRPTAADPAKDTEDALAELLDWADDHLGGLTLICAGHRVVHGGRAFTGPVRITSDVLATIEALAPLAPLHQPHNIAGIRAVAAVRAQLSQTASFDTAFHSGHDPVVARLGLPRRYEDEGVRRYGFHGLSYDYVAARLAVLDPALAAGRVIAAHLGSGASLCALAAGRSVDVTMGFSALDGLVMGTRCGTLDPGVVLYLQDRDGLDTAAVTDLLYRRSGLLGVSGISGDMRMLLASPDPAAREAIDLFAFRAAKEAAGMAATLRGLDGIVFTAGIGENAPSVRALICERMDWLGVKLDPAANQKGGEGRISAAGSRVAVWIVPTDEEHVIATEASRLIAG